MRDGGCVWEEKTPIGAKRMTWETDETRVCVECGNSGAGGLFRCDCGAWACMYGCGDAHERLCVEARLRVFAALLDELAEQFAELESLVKEHANDSRGEL